MYITSAAVELISLSSLLPEKLLSLVSRVAHHPGFQLVLWLFLLCLIGQCDVPAELLWELLLLHSADPSV